VAMTALNLIDNHRQAIEWNVRPLLKNLPTKGNDPPVRADKYVLNLLQYLLAK
jgi:uncharacterized sulfatase